MELQRKRGAAWSAGILLGLFALGIPACRSTGLGRVLRVAPAASAAMSHAQELLRGGEAQQALARAELERAAQLAPDWVAPRRALDDLARGELRGVEALREHRAALALRPDDPAELYLAGRLEGRSGVWRFERAVRSDPTCAFAWHGLSWSAVQRGERSEALQAARRALELARDPWERTFFTQNLARLLGLAVQSTEAARVLSETAERPDTAPHDRIALHVQAVGLALEAPDLGVRTRGYERGIELLNDELLSEDEVADLSARLRRSSSLDDPGRDRLLLALSARSSPVRERLRGTLLLDDSPSPLALNLLLSGASLADAAAIPARELRSARFWNGAYSEACEGWLASLPRVVLDEKGWPRSVPLRSVIERVRALPSASQPSEVRAPALTDFGTALIAAGWFREARGVAAELARLDLRAALELDQKALAGLGLVEDVERALRRIDLREVLNQVQPTTASRDDPWRSLLSVARKPARDLDELLEELAGPCARAHAFLGGETSPELERIALLASPRLDFAPIGSLVHPGPFFSAEDQRNELGERGMQVGGLAAEMARLGRFAVFGQMLGGGGPDATLLPTVLVEPQSGEHLGVKWEGTLAWCEASEVKTRAGRAGAQISAAAVHEGYWLDIDAVRGEQAHWLALVQHFDGPDAAERVAAVLAVGGLELSARDEDERARERRSSSALLGESSRVRLALLSARAAPGEVLGSIALDELVRVTGMHEEGHLCDRARFLPLGRHLGAALLFALECGFSPQRIQEQLEYRAQLTALCDAPDVRVPLAQVLDAVEGGANGITPHAAGYLRLLDDLLTTLDEQLARYPAHYPSLDPDRSLAHQLHRLASDELRGVALQLARRKRLLN